MFDVFGIAQHLAMLGQHIFVTVWDGFLRALQIPLQPVAADVSYIYLLSSLPLVLIVYALWARKKGKTLTLKDAFYFVFPKHVWKHYSAWLDIQFFPVFYITNALIIAPVAAFSGLQSARLGEYLFNLSPFSHILLKEPGVLVFLLMGLLVFMIYDFLFFLMHRIQHAVPFFWEFHKTHHSASVLHPFTNYRMHVVDALLFSPVFFLVIPLCTSFVAAFFGYSFSGPTILGISAFSFVSKMVILNLYHSHVWIAFRPRWLGYIIISPAHHQIHHSKASRHLDKNFGGSIALWDWLFGTLYLPREREKLVFGLADHSEVEYNTLWRLLWLPFPKAFGLKPLNNPQNNFSAPRLTPSKTTR